MCACVYYCTACVHLLKIHRNITHMFRFSRCPRYDGWTATTTPSGRAWAQSWTDRGCRRRRSGCCGTRRPSRGAAPPEPCHPSCSAWPPSPWLWCSTSSEERESHSPSSPTTANDLPRYGLNPPSPCSILCVDCIEDSQRMGEYRERKQKAVVQVDAILEQGVFFHQRWHCCWGLD